IAAQARSAMEDRRAEHGSGSYAEHASGEAAPARDAGLGHEPPEEQHGLGPFPEHTDEGDDGDHPDPVVGARGFDTTLDLALDGPRVLSHPPAMPREHDHGDEEHDGADHIGAEVEQRAREDADRDAGRDAGGRAEHAPEG